MKHYARAAIVLAVISTMSAWAHADAGTSVQASLSNLSFQLTALDGNNGSTSLVGKDAAWQGLLARTSNGDYQPLGTPQTTGFLLGGGLQSTSVTTPDGINAITYGGSTVSATTVAPASTPLTTSTDVTTNPTSVYTTMPDGSSMYVPGTVTSTTTTYGYASAPVSVLCVTGPDACVNRAYGVMTLSAHTALDIYGSANILMNVDRTSLINHYQDITSPLKLDNVTTFAASLGEVAGTAAIAIGDVNSDPGSWGLYANPEAMADAYLDYSHQGFAGTDYSYTDTSLTNTLSLQKNLHFRFENNGDTDMDIGVMLLADAMHREEVSVTNNTNTVDVPEPATFALMGLGLVGLALARRRLAD